MSRRCPTRWQSLERQRVKPLTPLPKPGMQTRPTCSRKFRAAWTSCSGWSKPTCNRRIECANPPGTISFMPPQPRFRQIDVALDAPQDFVVDDVLVAETQNHVA